ncbi:protein-L-isoaspartate(D-aspartate) O-methyltransferase [Amycolatopsis sp. cg5]|uniref:protein-L-isoaspartate(D-aspartate) O-methyltransferase n=1 Tax=Amycolatopsis sp. cg5 TaxID=3238802 RepID=UPI003524C809
METAGEEANWRRLFDEVPRWPFIPSLVWVDNPAGRGFVSLSRDEEPERWHAYVKSDEPIVTQVDDGRFAVTDVGQTPTSSNSKPSLVAEMLDVLELQPGHRVLEIGTGTGWNAALLSSRVGPAGVVVSIEIDPAIALSAKESLSAAGYGPIVVVADGSDGYAHCAMYDRVIATASVRRIPRAWIEQTSPRGVIVAPWGTDYCNGALLRLTVADDGSASGRFGRNLEFMRVRSQRREFIDPTDEQIAMAHRSTTSLRGHNMYELVEFSRAAFAIGLRVPNCYRTVEETAKKFRHIVELHDTTTRSWARVDTDPDVEAFEVLQFGPRCLWDEVEAAYDWWRDRGEPGPERFGLTTWANGGQEVWLDEPGGADRWAVD